MDAIEQLGCKVTSQAGKLPIVIEGGVKQHKVALDPSLSSQYLSALLLVAPQMPKGLTIELTKPLASASYAFGTLTEMKRRGVQPATEAADIYTVPVQRYNGGRVEIEGDASSATYHMAMATLHAGSVTIQGIGASTWQSDGQFTSVCEALGSTVQRDSSDITMCGTTNFKVPNHYSFDMSQMPDAGPTLMAIAPYLPAPITITGLATLKYKECDRIECPATELRKSGIQVKTGDDWISIKPGKPQPTEFDTYDDHRMAMSFAVLASRATNCRIKNPGCVNKTYSNFWRDFALAYD